MNCSRVTLTLFAVLMICVCSAWADQLDDGVAAYKRGDYTSAFATFWVLASVGNAQGQYNLGVMYANGQGISKNDAEAVKWFRLAAEQGYANAQYALGLRYYTGRGGAQDHAEALKWYWLAAGQGNAGAQYGVGSILDEGKVLPQNYTEAVKWYRLAAAQGDESAQTALGFKYLIGQGVAQDYVRAHMWFNLGAVSGKSPHASEGRDLTGKRMTAQQIALAQSMAQSCKGSNFKQCGEPTEETNIPSPKNGEAEKSQGSGFFVSKDGYLITNEHVVASCGKIVAINASNQEIPLRIIRASKSEDLALLKADAKPPSVAVFRVSPRLNQGESVIAYGFPLAGLLASGGNVTTGNVTALSGLRDDGRQMQISAPVQPGNSGGPLVDVRGLVIGVVTSKLNAMKVAQITDDIPQNVNFAIKTSSVINLLDSSSVKYETIQPLRGGQSVDAITQELKKYTVKIECN